jgi:hypothetical protein
VLRLPQSPKTKWMEEKKLTDAGAGETTRFKDRESLGRRAALGRTAWDVYVPGGGATSKACMHQDKTHPHALTDHAP